MGCSRLGWGNTMKKFRARKIVLVLSDIIIMLLSGIVVNYLLQLLGTDIFLGKDYSVPASRLAICLFTNVAICVITLWGFGAYSKMWRYFNKKDYLSCFLGITIGMALSISIQLCFSQNITGIFIVLNYIISLIGIIAFRFIFRKTFLNLTEAGRLEIGKKTMIVGAGRATMMILTELKNAKNIENNSIQSIVPVCLVDDDMAKQGLTLEGVRVEGTTNDIEELCKVHGISLIIFSIPSCTAEEHKRIIDICSRTQCEIKVVPYLSNLLLDGGDSQILNQIKDIKIEDLLGRDPITFDKEDIKKLVENKVCMVTGGGGSIGSELVRQIAKYNPAQVIIVDIYENNAYDIQQELVMEYGDKLNLVTLIASVRDYDKMNEIFRKYVPNLVFHAAAHKHVPLMETSPEEAVKNNIMGTFNVATLAEFYDADKFIMISTDKAVNPTNVMGATKRCCEMIVQYKSQHSTKTEFVTTRFGNVLGSNGSVIPLFRRQIESGRPVTVTHPDIIRYFMTIPEAVSLVLQAGAMAHGGEIFVLDMGDPVKITVLAENLIRMYGKTPYKDVEIKFTGLRPGEKLFEELLMDEEGLKSTANKKIFIGNQIKINEYDLLHKLEVLTDYATANDRENTIRMLSDIVPTFHHETNENNKIDNAQQEKEAK